MRLEIELLDDVAGRKHAHENIQVRWSRADTRRLSAAPPKV